jgi:hypothetical protein
MNYRHAFHAGNFADVHKHAVLGRVLTHLRLKPAPFRVIDTHAGAGRYDLSRPEPARTGEWRHGIARVWEASLPAEPQRLLAPYLGVVSAFNPSQTLGVYPGSPLIAQGLLRSQDRLIACELEPTAATSLAGPSMVASDGSTTTPVFSYPFGGRPENSATIGTWRRARFSMRTGMTAGEIRTTSVPAGTRSIRSVSWMRCSPSGTCARSIEADRRSSVRFLRMASDARRRTVTMSTIRVCSCNGEWMNDWFTPDADVAAFKPTFTRDAIDAELVALQEAPSRLFVTEASPLK